MEKEQSEMRKEGLKVKNIIDSELYNMKTKINLNKSPKSRKYKRQKYEGKYQKENLFCSFKL